MLRRYHMFQAFVLLLVMAWLSSPATRTTAATDQAAPVTIVGSVVDAALTPLGGVAVMLERQGQVVARTTTDPAGRFRFAGVEPGAYRVRAEVTGLPPFVRDLLVPAGAGTVRLPLVLGRAEEAEQKALSDDRAEARASGASRMPAPPPTAPAVDSAARRDGGLGGGRDAYATGEMSVSQTAPAVREQPGAVRSEDRSRGYRQPAPGESYTHIHANQFQLTRDQPLSTFGADVDTASYANVRRFISAGQLPPRDAVRVEELVNYFRFGYAEPGGRHPISLTTEVGDCPWDLSHKLVLVGARARASAARETAGRNLVLLIDVSGSMAPANRLPLIKTALRLFVDTLQADDRLAIVTYAGTSGVALPPTPVRRRDTIQRAIANLSAGGSTNGGRGLITAYRLARQTFIPGGVNRVILASDGDFNVGIVDQQALVRLIERERDSGVFLSIFGVGNGNLKDSTMEMLADRGNGHYAYLDSLQEARRVLLREANATLENVAKDVKFQVEFNPATVSAWKLIGYENRALAAEDFNDDRKDGGEMGAGHTVTVLYEVVPAGGAHSDDGWAGGRPAVDPLKYQAQALVTRPAPRATTPAGEWLTVKVRYKQPEGEVSNLITLAVRPGNRVRHLPFASAVAQFGLILRDSPRDVGRWEALARRVATLSVPTPLVSDKNGFGELVETARGLARLR